MVCANMLCASVCNLLSLLHARSVSALKMQGAEWTSSAAGVLWWKGAMAGQAAGLLSAGAFQEDVWLTVQQQSQAEDAWCACFFFNQLGHAHSVCSTHLLLCWIGLAYCVSIMRLHGSSLVLSTAPSAVCAVVHAACTLKQDKHGMGQANVLCWTCICWQGLLLQGLPSSQCSSCLKLAHYTRSKLLIGMAWGCLLVPYCRVHAGPWVTWISRSHLALWSVSRMWCA